MPAEVLAVEAVAADLERVGRGADRPGLRLGRDLRAVDVEAQRRAVVRQTRVGPGVGASAPPAPYDRRVANRAECAAARRRAPAGRGRLEVVVVVALVDHVAPGADTVEGLTHASSVIPRRSAARSASGTLTRALVPLKVSALPYFPAAPGRVRDRPVVAGARRIRRPSSPTLRRTRRPRRAPVSPIYRLGRGGQSTSRQPRVQARASINVPKREPPLVSTGMQPHI